MMCSTTATTTASLSVVRGESKTYEVTVRDAAKQTVDLTGAKVWFTVKERLEDISPVISKRNVAAGGSALEAEVTPQTGTTKGKLRIYLTPSDSANLDTTKTYVCDVWIELTSGKRHQVIKRRAFVVDPAVTTVF